MEDTLHFIQLADLFHDDRKEGKWSSTVTRREGVNVMMIYLPAGESLPEHSTTNPTIVHFLEGSGEITLEEEVRPVNPGSLIYMPAGFSHSVAAKEDLKFILYIIKCDV